RSIQLSYEDIYEIVAEKGCCGYERGRSIQLSYWCIDVFWAVCKLHISVNRHFSVFGSTIAFAFAEPLHFLL
ncbi:MAG: hypothetical protein RRY10_04960, partial [Christensenellaceae bacterium]